MSRASAKKSAWFKNKAANGCQMCGCRIPNLPNNGLRLAHILPSEIGGDKEHNVVALCANCEHAFDDFLKPAIYRAMVASKCDKVPTAWSKPTWGVQDEDI